MTDLFSCLSTSITLGNTITPCFPQCMRLHHISISIILRKPITPCYPQYNYAHKNFEEKLCPACHAARRRHRAETAPHPRRTERLTPLPFATPCTQIYCENTGIHTLPYFQTGTLSHACHVTDLFNCLSTSITLGNAIMPCFPQCNYAPHCACTTSPSALYCENQSRLASPNITTHTKIFEKSYAQRATQPGAGTAPKPPRTRAAQSVSHRYLSQPRALRFTVKTQGFTHFLTFKLARCPTPATQTVIS